MRKHLIRFVGAALVTLFAGALATPSQAETCAVRVVFTKGGFIVGVGGGRRSDRRAQVSATRF